MLPSSGCGPAAAGKPDNVIICTTSVWPALVKSSDASVPPLGNGEGFVFVFAGSTTGWSLSTADSWLFPSGIESGNGYVRLGYEVESNGGKGRQTTVQVKQQGCTVKTLDIFQFGGSPVTGMKQLVLESPTSTQRGKIPPFSLLIMELGILGKFIAKEIKKLPAEGWPVALAAVAGIIEAIAASLVAACFAFAEVPEPPDYFSSDPVPMEVLLVEQQANLLIAYISEQLVSGG